MGRRKAVVKGVEGGEGSTCSGSGEKAETKTD